MLAQDRPKTREPAPQEPENIPANSISSKTIDSKPIAKVGPLVLPEPVITWEKLPADFILPKDPVDNINQPEIAASLTESLLLADLIPEQALVCTDYGIIAVVDGKTIAKAPDWAYVANITVSQDEVERSYTPQLEGEVPTIVLEFLSATDGTEYSIKPEKPMGKWYFYERILKVPYYGIFEPSSGDFQVYFLGESGCYDRLPIEESGRYWIAPMNLSIAAWKGKRRNRKGYWLRWWDADGNLLPWAPEIQAQQQAAIEDSRQLLEQERQLLEQERQLLEQERQRAEQERQRAEQESQRAEQESQRADRLAAQLRELGLDPE